MINFQYREVGGGTRDSKLRTTMLTFLRKLKWIQNWILRLIYKIRFSIFWSVSTVFGLIVSKKCNINMAAKIFFPNTVYQYEYKTRRISWKSSKNVYTQKVRRLRTLVHSTKMWCFYAHNFLWEFFYTVFNGFEIGIKNLRFLTPISKCCGKNIFGVILAHFSNFELTSTTRLRKSKKNFQTWIKIKSYVCSLWLLTFDTDYCD